MGASFANAGLISPGHCFSWAEPGVVRMALKSFLGLADGIGICRPWSAKMLRWSGLFAREGTRERWFENSRAALALATYSRNILFRSAEIPLDAFGGSLAGILYLYGDNSKPSEHDAQLLREAREPFDVLDAEQVLEREPLLRGASVRFRAAVYCQNDGTGDAARYANACVTKALELGAKLRCDENVLGFETTGDTVTAVHTSLGRYAADSVVVTAGLESSDLVARLGYDLPIYPVTGYSVTYKAMSQGRPRVGAVSIPHKIAWAAFDDTVRFTGFADIGVPSKSRAESRFRALQAFAAQVYPETDGYLPAQWVGRRPMTPDNLPFLGISRHRNMWFNCGHGAMGWTMACGSAQIIADLVSHRSPAIDMGPYRWDRYRLFGRSAVTRASIMEAVN